MTEQNKLDRTMAIVGTKVQIAESHRGATADQLRQLVGQVADMLAKGERVADEVVLQVNQLSVRLVALNAEANALRAVIEKGLR